MKFLSRLEKQKIVWVLILLCVAFFFLRLPSIIEPYWYGDEAVYEVIGQSLNHGHLLYRDIWDNKPPLLYGIYAVANGDQSTVKIFSLLFGIVTIILFYLLSEKVFNKKKVSISLTVLFMLLLGTPLLEANIANAEVFILLPTILGGLLIYKATIKQKFSSPYSLVPSPFLAGLLLGIAFLLKIVAVFDLAAFLIFYIIVTLPKNVTWSSLRSSLLKEIRRKRQTPWFHTLVLDICILLLGFLVPFFITVLYFAFNHSLKDFIQAAFFGNVDYVGYKNTLFAIPQGLLILKILLLALVIYLVFKFKKRLTAPTIFILLWLVFSLFNVYFSGRPYTHYSIVLIPSFCLFIGLLFTKYSLRTKAKILAVLLILIFALNNQFQFNINRTYLYYQNALQFLNGQKSIEAYQTFFDQKVPRDYNIANFIATRTKATDSIFVWGNNPEIYALTHKTPINKYIVAYHVSQNNAFDETQKSINMKLPKFIIVLTESQPLPFVIPLYIMRYNIAGATIYERSF